MTPRTGGRPSDSALAENVAEGILVSHIQADQFNGGPQCLDLADAIDLRLARVPRAAPPTARDRVAATGDQDQAPVLRSAIQRAKSSPRAPRPPVMR